MFLNLSKLVGLATLLAGFTASNVVDAASGLIDLGVKPTGSVSHDGIANGIDLRILPIGDGVVAGLGSSDGNGFRAYLKDGLSGANKVEVAIADVFSAIAQQVGELVDLLFEQCPDAAILLAQIIRSGDATQNEAIDAFNDAVPQLPVLNSGKHVRLVDMSSIQANRFSENCFYPDDKGYKLMANQWLDGIKKAVDDGWIKKPVAQAPEPFVAVDQDPLQKRS
ncbi:MAG: hypothetical protein Q9174_007408, partial [Haloplaca sp. 1 TL-2023]